MQPPSKLAELLLRIELPRAPRRDFATPAENPKRRRGQKLQHPLRQCLALSWVSSLGHDSKPTRATGAHPMPPAPLLENGAHLSWFYCGNN